MVMSRLLCSEYRPLLQGEKMTIRVICNSCGSKLNARDELRGQTRNCPKCGRPVLIEPVVSDSANDATNASDNGNAGLKMLRMRQDNLYVILGADREIAYWKANEGWLINVGSGYQLSKRVPDRIPDVGNYVLVEGYVEQTDSGRRLKGLRFRALHGRGVLNALVRNETEILEKASEPTTLTQAQKRFLLEHIRKNYFFDFTEGSLEITEYLTGFDAHAREVGKFIE